METTVEKLEAMFLKAEADLDYIEKRLKLDFINSSAENGCPAENNLAVVLENLKAIKSKHSALCSQVKELTSAQKESVDSIRNNLSSVMELLQHFEQTTDMEVCSAVAASHQEQPQSSECEELTAAMLESLPSSVRSNIKLADLNAFYQQLQQHLGKSNRGSLSVQKMKQLKMNVSDAKLKVLQQLSLVELDSKGHVRLVL
ncbi:SKA complex subunit 2 isoform X2 [Oreochromis niloticus]|uniref:SKA complex subunit 2 isoform X2 n=1 Tax=Oreochromis niloticus TaxID=8128 RepID=UPI0003941F36|nr:spindle and kinetochore-associated protein 2 isoform X2 [Oreochromis niloticus]XP_031586275.1 spindle and kinetochore-associated protein 2 isoform X2 [Oreochromis aureus]CAI5644541.1 unnamed protein product [Mustela putorius furo]